MWQDDFISMRDGEYVCWDHRGEFIATAVTRDQARTILSEYTTNENRAKQSGNTIQQLNEVKQR